MFEEQDFPSRGNLGKKFVYSLTQKTSAHGYSLKNTHDNIIVIGWQLF